MIGFEIVSETALGAEIVSRETARFLDGKTGGVYISSACPSIVELVCKYYPNLIDSLAPIHSPMVAHGKMLKALYGDDAQIVFFGPCISKKRESDEYKNTIDFALTFKDLRKWLFDEGIDLAELAADDSTETFMPYPSNMGSIYPIDGGMNAGIQQLTQSHDVLYMSFSGTDGVRQALTDLTGWDSSKKLFLELLTCAGGCVHGPSTEVRESTATKRYRIASELQRRKPSPIQLEAIGNLDISRNYQNLTPVIRCTYTEEDIRGSLSAIGKLSDKDEINCGGCGYDSCRDFARALLEGYAERNMCVSYMRRVAHDKATVLLQKIPSGVLLVDEDMKAIECNRSFARMMGPEIEMIYEANPGLQGATVSKLIPFHKLFSSVLNTGKDIIDRDVRFENKVFNVSVFTVLQHKIACGIMRNLVIPEVRNDEVVKRAKQVIQENLETVQKIAYLLGENASRTESMLNTILEANKADEERND